MVKNMVDGKQIESAKLSKMNVVLSLIAKAVNSNRGLTLKETKRIQLELTQLANEIKNGSRKEEQPFSSYKEKEKPPSANVYYGIKLPQGFLGC